MTGAPARFQPPLPHSRPAGAGWLTRWRLARRDLFSAAPARLYRAWMAEMRAPFTRSFLINQPDLVRHVLIEKAGDFPKSTLLADALADLLGASVFVTNGDTWRRQRRIIDPAFEGGRLKAVFPAMATAAAEFGARLAKKADGEPVEIEFETAYAAADVIFRTLFSIPIAHQDAQAVFHAFRRYQQAAPLVDLWRLLGAPGWLRGRRRGREHGAEIRALLTAMVERRRAEIAAGTAPDDLATKIMTTPDPETGETFGDEEMVDQVAIFFLAGHETSASALAWTLYCLANDEGAQARARDEAGGLSNQIAFSDLRRLGFIRDVFREGLRLYPPVPMMAKQAGVASRMRGRDVPKGALILISPWHLGRHERLWDDSHLFDPDRWAGDNAQARARDAFMPFSAGPRVCVGAGFAMAEGVLLLAEALRAVRLEPVAGRAPRPVTQLTVRSDDGIWLRLSPVERGAQHEDADRAG